LIAVTGVSYIAQIGNQKYATSPFYISPIWEKWNIIWSIIYMLVWSKTLYLARIL
jgi:hypothetical protein